MSKAQWAYKSLPGQLWSYIFIYHCYPEEGNIQISGNFAPALAARLANSSNYWKPCCGDEIHTFCSPSGTARDTDLKPEPFFSWDICHCSKPTCLISPLIYMVSDQVLSNSSHTQHSKCRCLSFKGLKTITKTITAFLPDTSPGRITAKFTN